MTLINVTSSQAVSTVPRPSRFLNVLYTPHFTHFRAILYISIFDDNIIKKHEQDIQDWNSRWQLLSINPSFYQTKLYSASAIWYLYIYISNVFPLFVRYHPRVEYVVNNVIDKKDRNCFVRPESTFSCPESSLLLILTWEQWNICTFC